MGREGDIAGKGGFFGGGGVKKVFARAGGSFGGEVWVSWGVRGMLRGKGLFRGGLSADAVFVAQTVEDARGGSDEDKQEHCVRQHVADGEVR